MARSCPRKEVKSEGRTEVGRMIKTAAAPGRPGDPYKVSQTCVGVGKADVTIAWTPAANADHYEVWHTWSQFLGTTTKTQFVIRGVDAPSTIFSPPSYYQVHVVAVSRDGGRAASNMVDIPVTACWQTSPCADKTGIARWWCERTAFEKAAIIGGSIVTVGFLIWLSAQKSIAAAGAPQITVVTGEGVYTE